MTEAHAATLGVMTQVALLSPFIQCKVLQTGLGLTASKPVHLPKQARSCGRSTFTRGTLVSCCYGMGVSDG